jgi:hypothetical protein
MLFAGQAFPNPGWISPTVKDGMDLNDFAFKPIVYRMGESPGTHLIVSKSFRMNPGKETQRFDVSRNRIDEVSTDALRLFLVEPIPLKEVPFCT